MGGRSGRSGREGGDVWGCAGEWGATPPSIQMMALGGATATALAASSNSAAAVHILLRIRADLPACRLAQYRSAVTARCGTKVYQQRCSHGTI
jgi:hypothetical protein